MTKVGFLIMSFQNSTAHTAIVTAIQRTLKRNGLLALRADKKQYNDNLVSNIKTYMWGCRFGIAVFERIKPKGFNPNVSFEVGYMLALQKPVYLLKDKTLRALPTDLVGKLYHDFDTQYPGVSIRQELEAWLRDKKLIPAS